MAKNLTVSLPLALGVIKKKRYLALVTVRDSSFSLPALCENQARKKLLGFGRIWSDLVGWAFWTRHGRVNFFFEKV
jgi:hypothetical protein